MTVQTWKKEFYPVSANHKMTKKQAIEHSLRKWEGLLPKNKAKHQITGDRFLTDGLYSFEIDADTCALCKKFYNEWAVHNYKCIECPLYKTLGHACSKADSKYPYEIYQQTGDPRPMIRALRKTLKDYDARRLK